jgi:hypothetical protein
MQKPIKLPEEISILGIGKNLIDNFSWIECEFSKLRNKLYILFDTISDKQQKEIYRYYNKKCPKEFDCNSFEEFKSFVFGG